MWTSNPGPLEEQAVLLTSEPSPQSPFPVFCFDIGFLKIVLYFYFVFLCIYVWTHSYHRMVVEVWDNLRELPSYKEVTSGQAGK